MMDIFYSSAKNRGVSNASNILRAYIHHVRYGKSCGKQSHYSGPKYYQLQIFLDIYTLTWS